MDEALEAIEIAADLGLESVLSWILRIVGLVAIVAGLGLWLGLGRELMVVPAVLMVGGVVLLVVPSILFELVA